MAILKGMIVCSAADTAEVDPGVAIELVEPVPVWLPQVQTVQNTVSQVSQKRSS